MSRVEMTTAEFRASKLKLPGAKKGKDRSKVPRDGAVSRCVTHNEQFTRDVDEDRHVNAHHGCRLEANNVQS